VAPGDRVMAVTGYGAFAEEVKTDARRVLPIPRGMTDETASAFPLTYGTSDHALVDRGGLKAGETLLVLGAAGGVGLAAIDIGKAIAARVIACASSAEKLAAAANRRRRGDRLREDLRGAHQRDHRRPRHRRHLRSGRRPYASRRSVQSPGADGSSSSASQRAIPRSR
jgi:NADPH2:quinone reductase